MQYRLLCLKQQCYTNWDQTKRSKYYLGSVNTLGLYWVQVIAGFSIAFVSQASPDFLTWPIGRRPALTPQLNYHDKGTEEEGRRKGEKGVRYFFGPELARRQPLADNDLAFFMPLLQQKRERVRQEAVLSSCCLHKSASWCLHEGTIFTSQGFRHFLRRFQEGTNSVL